VVILQRKSRAKVQILFFCERTGQFEHYRTADMKIGRDYFQAFFLNGDGFEAMVVHSKEQDTEKQYCFILHGIYFNGARDKGLKFFVEKTASIRAFMRRVAVDDAIKTIKK
jgi:hypothetical protein